MTNFFKTVCLFPLLGLWILLSFSCANDEKKACASDDFCGKKEICVEQKCIAGCRKSEDCSPSEICLEQICTTQLCQPGSRKACFDGQNDTRGVGLCREGFQVCNEDGKAWSPCVLQQTAQKEICDQADNDCNGQIDDGIACDCLPGEKKACYNGPKDTLGVGTCRQGMQYCESDGKWGACFGQVLPTEEVCDQMDNNCNGVVDDGLNCECKPGESRSCYTGKEGTALKGICKQGTQSCTNNSKWGACIGQVLPQLEENEPCNGIDDDCDGFVDNRSGKQEKQTDFCYDGSKATRKIKPCSDGLTTCLEGGKWSECLPDKNGLYTHTLPKKEDCNGLDDDCDGKIDNDITKVACFSGTTGCTLLEDGTYSCKGSCKTGWKSCEQGQWSECKGQTLPQAKEICGNGLDEDCNGLADDECTCTSGTTLSCYTGTSETKNKGECKSGTMLCQNNKYEACTQEVLPQIEICDGKDNDCNGVIDDISDQDQACEDPSRVGECKKGKWICHNNARICFQTVQPIAESCNSKDDDCNGVIDDISDKDQYCVTGKGQGNCNDGKWICLNDQKVCQPVVTPSAEICNGQDDDCDGVIDNIVGNCVVSGKYGECSVGSYFCQNEPSGWVKLCRQSIPPKAEICNNLDDDCNGKIDDIEDAGKDCVDSYQKGRCQQGKWACKEGNKTCISSTTPTTEVCNGLDDDCDGTIDNMQGSCTVLDATGNAKNVFGICQIGILRCKQEKSVWTSYCVATNQPTTEICNGLDDDCDGTIDNIPDLNKSCTLGDLFGLCRIGQVVCEYNAQVCKQTYDGANQVEICNNKDDDCNGQVDENLERKCSNACNTGKEICNFGNWVLCNAAPVGKEVCNNKDDDCNGYIDDLTEECTIAGAQGPCSKGIQSCDASLQTVCKANAIPTTEVCDGVDNDCNGQIDEGFPDEGKLCCLAGGNGTLGYTLCSGGKIACYKPPHTSNLNVSNEIWLPPATFSMGADSNDATSQVDEKPPFQATLTRPFAIQKYEVTQKEFKDVMGYNPSTSTNCKKNNCPVDSVSWHEAASYANLLSKKHNLETCYVCSPTETTATQVDDSRQCQIKVEFENDYSKCRGFRLLTEAEWEYAYRAKTKTPYFIGTYCSNVNGYYCFNACCDQATLMKDSLGNTFRDYAWYHHDSSNSSQVVGSKLSNPYDLCDMAGNVWEWTYDIYGTFDSSAKIDPVGRPNGNERVLKGGGFSSFIGDLTASSRSKGRHLVTIFRGINVGFRIGRTLHQKEYSNAFQTCSQ